VLGQNFCGAYLHGSFATGDADVSSDVDFIIVTHEELTGEQQTAVQAMHRRIYAMETPWAQHLEGSYVTAKLLRCTDWSQVPFFYLDNGAQEFVWDSHCNTAVVRWLLREHGRVLAGPDPRTLVDRVSAAELQREGLARVQAYAEWAREQIDKDPMSRWKQPYLVLTLCRLLFTLAEGRVASKGEAGEWALGTLDREWRDLVRRAIDDRANPWERTLQPADRDIVERTLHFADYAVTRAARWAQEHPSVAGR
jgi:hypothetical protein